MDESIVTVVIPNAPSSVSNVLSSVTEDTAVGAAGFVISIICTPSSATDATRAYVDEPL